VETKSDVKTETLTVEKLTDAAGGVPPTTARRQAAEPRQSGKWGGIIAANRKICQCNFHQTR
jgi:hypothetical protein